MRKPTEKKPTTSLQKFKDWFYMITITLLLVFTIESRIVAEKETSRLSYEIVKMKFEMNRKASKLDTMEYIDRRLTNRNAMWPLPENLRDKN